MVGTIQPPSKRVGMGGRTCNCPISPQSQERTRRGRRSDSLALLNHSSERQRRPAVAARAVRGQPVVMFEQASKRAAINHRVGWSRQCRTSAATRFDAGIATGSVSASATAGLRMVLAKLGLQPKGFRLVSPRRFGLAGYRDLRLRGRGDVRRRLAGTGFSLIGHSQLLCCPGSRHFRGNSAPPCLVWWVGAGHGPARDARSIICSRRWWGEPEDFRGIRNTNAR